MPLPGKWTIEEIITLSMYKKIYSAQFRNAVESYENLEELLSSTNVSSLSDRFKQETIFGNINHDVRDLAIDQIELCSRNNVDIITYWDDIYP